MMAMHTEQAFYCQLMGDGLLTMFARFARVIRLAFTCPHNATSMSTAIVRAAYV